MVNNYWADTNQKKARVAYIRNRQVLLETEDHDMLKVSIQTGRKDISKLVCT